MAEVCLANSDLAARDSGAPLKVPSYGLPADIWATGILAYELLVGGSPFEADTKEETYDKIMGCQLWLPSHLSQHAQDFIRKVGATYPFSTDHLMHMVAKGTIIHCRCI